MFGSTVLEVGVGLVFVYWILGLLCSTINEQVIVPILKLRATTLEEGIKNLLDDPQGDKLVNDLYNNTLITGLSRKYDNSLIQRVPLLQNLFKQQPGAQQPGAQQPGAQQPDKPKRGKPSYIPGDTFAIALMSLDAVQAYKKDPTAENGPIPQALKSLLKSAQGDPAAPNDPATVLATELASIEKWFNDAMDRVTGWYKRDVQWIIFFLGLVIVLALNVDTISIITGLSNSTSLRSAIVSAAQGSANGQSNANLGALQKGIAQISPVIGWTTSTSPTDVGSWILKILGLLATTLAVSLGAPFWFDLLNKFMAFRSSGPVPQPRTGPSESTGAPQQLAVTVAGAPPAANPPPGGNA